jgi:hypothetical protein
VTVGSQWTGDVLLPVPGTRQYGKGVSTITSLKHTNGITYCVIESAVDSSRVQSFDSWALPVARDGMEIQGTTEGCFDIKHGIWLQTRLDLDAKIEGQTGEQGYTGVIKIKGTTKIVSSKLLPPDKAVQWSRRIKALDGALGELYRNEYGTAIQSLERQKQEETDAGWRNGIEVVLSIIIHRYMPGAPKAKPNEVVRRKSTDAKVETNKNAPASPNIKAPGQKDAVASAMAVCKQAGEYALAGELEKALKSYEAFLATTDDGIPVAIRMLAQYRTAGLYEKTGQRQKALEAYRAMDAIEADDDYSRKLKEKAKGNAEQLSAGK